MNRQTMAGYTPLHIAAISGKSDFVRFLLESGANRDLRDKEGLTPAERAVQFPAMSYSSDGARAVDTSSSVDALKECRPK